jgi:predicted hotdog family 3-hydroxylacyl-ACP dehydratase
MSAWPPIATLLPHAPPMLVLEELLEWSPGSATARMTVRSNGPFVRDGAVAGVCALEFMAQCVAACLGCEARQAGERVRVGVVIAVRELVIERASLPVGTELRIRVQRIRGSDTLSVFETTAEDGDRPVARAVMTLLHGAAPAASSEERPGASPGTPDAAARDTRAPR